MEITARHHITRHHINRHCTPRHRPRASRTGAGRLTSRFLRSGLIFVLVLAASLASSVRAQSPFAISNLEVATGARFTRDWLVFRRPEFGGEPRDLNEDGDTEDEVFHLRKLETGAVVNLRLSASSFRIFLDVLVLCVRERDEGNEDLNEDGDSGDLVLHIVDLGEDVPEARNLELAATPVGLFGSRIVLAVREAEQGGRDLNGDGDAGDEVLHLLDPRTGIVENLGVSAAAPTPTGRLLALNVREADQGGVDLNDDGDVGDAVLHLLDPETGELRNLRLPPSRALGPRVVSGKWLVFPVDEVQHGERDLNGDGDTGDSVFHVVNLETGDTVNLERSGAGLRVFRDWIAFTVDDPSGGWLHVQNLETGAIHEVRGRVFVFGTRVIYSREESSGDGGDLNGDGDTEDSVLQVLTLDTGTTTNTGLAATSPRLFLRSIAVQVDETAQGGKDLNGDGDTADAVLHLWNLENETSTNLEVAAAEFFFFGRWIAMQVSEAANGGKDLNDDGDGEDTVLHLRDLESGMTTNLAVAAVAPRAAGRSLFFEVDEGAQGEGDLNGDGDAKDLVLHILEVGDLTVTNLEIATDLGGRIYLFGSQLVFEVLESAHGARDLNGDGDATDRVVHVRDLDTGRTVNLGLATNLKSLFPVFRGGTRIYLWVVEADHGRDLDGDGEATKAILHELDLDPDTPVVPVAAFRRGDTDASGVVDISDPIYNLTFQFVGGIDPPPVPGEKECGPDPTDDDRTCDAYPQEKC